MIRMASLLTVPAAFPKKPTVTWPARAAESHREPETVGK